MCDDMSLPVTFRQCINELLLDGESNSNIELSLLRFPTFFHQCVTDCSWNKELLWALIESCVVPGNNRAYLNTELLHMRAKLMQKLIINDEDYLFEFMAYIIERLHYNKALPFSDIDRVIGILHFENVITTFARNAWSFAKNPEGKPTGTLDKLNAIKTCLRLKLGLFNQL